MPWGDGVRVLNNYLKFIEQRLYENATQMPTLKANAGRHIRKASRETEKEE